MCQGQLRMGRAAVGMSTPPRCWVSPAAVGDVQAGGIGQECAGRDPVYFRGAAAALNSRALVRAWAGPCSWPHTGL